MVSRSHEAHGPFEDDGEVTALTGMTEEEVLQHFETICAVLAKNPALVADYSRLYKGQMAISPPYVTSGGCDIIFRLLNISLDGSMEFPAAERLDTPDGGFVYMFRCYANFVAPGGHRFGARGECSSDEPFIAADFGEKKQPIGQVYRKAASLAETRMANKAMRRFAMLRGLGWAELVEAGLDRELVTYVKSEVRWSNATGGYVVSGKPVGEGGQSSSPSDSIPRRGPGQSANDYVWMVRGTDNWKEVGKAAKVALALASFPKKDDWKSYTTEQYERIATELDRVAAARQPAPPARQPAPPARQPAPPARQPAPPARQPAPPARQPAPPEATPDEAPPAVLKEIRSLCDEMQKNAEYTGRLLTAHGWQGPGSVVERATALAVLDRLRREADEFRARPQSKAHGDYDADFANDDIPF